MKPKFGIQYRVKRIDAFGDSQWTDEDDLTKLITQFEKPADQTLYFLKQADEFYIFTSAKPEAGKPYIDIHGIPRGSLHILVATTIMFALANGHKNFLLLFLLILVSGAFLGEWSHGGLSRIYLTKKHEQPSFWTRNKDELIRQVFSNLLAFGLGLLAAYLLFVKGVH